MDPERALRIEQLYSAALEREESERPVFLDDACGDDSELRRELESLLDYDKRTDNFLDGRALDAMAKAMALDPSGSQEGGNGFVDDEAISQDRIIEKPPDTVYRLVKKLGEGGMGQVWQAEQTSPVRRQVALKLIKAGMYDEAVVQRFQSERQSLAIMNHPSIAKVFDVGATPQGQPYFVMEYVPGLPITEYCDQKKLRIRQRLALFIQACEGVQHAHQKAIIHRDLKPANILVIEVDGKPTPRIIDFGLAKATTPQAAEQSLITQLGSLVGTPGYMSPEQADPGVQDIDTRADVYALGVVLYVLLTGLQPIDPKKWKNQPLDELLRRLREEEPPSPSTKVSTDRDTSSATAEARGTEPKQLQGLLRGDLDWITMKALEKDRSRRYGAPSELAADIRRYLNHQPVMARPASAGYLLRKYARRHRVVVSAASGLALLLTVFSILQAAELRRITRERDRANRERDRATRITDFMTNMFKVSDPGQTRGNSVTAREILDKASSDINTGLAADPRLQAQMMSVMGNVYDNLGLYSRAQPLLAKAAALRSQVLGPESPETLASMDALAKVLRELGHNSEAEKIERDTLDKERRGLRMEDPETLRTMSQLAWTLKQEGHYSEAEKLDRESLEIEGRVLGPEDPQTLSTMNDLASVLRTEGNYAEAEKMDQDALEKRRRVLGTDHVQTLESMTNLASDAAYQGHYARAEKLDRENLAIVRRVHGPEHFETLGAMSNLADDLVSEGLYAEAEKLGDGALEGERRVLGPENPQTVDAMDNLAAIHRKEGHYAAAEELDRQTLEIRRRLLGPEHPNVLESTTSLASDLDLRHDYAEAEKLLRDALDIERRVLGLQNPRTLEAMQQLAATTAHLGRYAEAEKLDRNTIQIARRALGADNPLTAVTEYHLAGLTARRGAKDESVSLLRQAVSGLDFTALRGMASDPAFKILHGDPRFESLIADARRRIAATQKPN